MGRWLSCIAFAFFFWLALPSAARAASLGGRRPPPELRYPRPPVTLCETETAMPLDAPIVPLRSESMPSLPQSGIWIVPGETLCVLAGPAPRQRQESQGGSPEWSELSHLLIVKRTNAATLRLSLEEESGMLALRVENPSPYLLHVGVASERGRSLGPGEGTAFDLPREFGGGLISGVSAKAVLLSESGEETARRTDWPRIREEESLNVGALVQAKHSDLTSVYDTLAPLGYEPRSNLWVAPGGFLSLRAGRAYFAFDFATSTRRWDGSPEPALKATHGSYNFSAGLALFRAGPLRVISVASLGSESFKLRFGREVDELPAWTEDYRKPGFVRVTSGAGILLETLLGPYTFVRTEVGGRLFLGKGKWRTQVNRGEDDSEDIPLTGPEILSPSPYVNMSLGLRIGNF